MSVTTDKTLTAVKELADRLHETEARQAEFIASAESLFSQIADAFGKMNTGGTRRKRRQREPPGRAGY